MVSSQPFERHRSPSELNDLPETQLAPFHRGGDRKRKAVTEMHIESISQQGTQASVPQRQLWGLTLQPVTSAAELTATQGHARVMKSNPLPITWAEHGLGAPGCNHF